MAIQKFVFLDSSTGLYKEQTQNDTLTVPNGVNSSDAVNKGQLDGVESALQALITAEEAARIAAVSAEQSARETAVAAVASDLAAEVARAEAAEGVLTSDLASEITRATAAETLLATDLAAEIARATAAELALGVRIDTEEAVRLTAVTDLSTMISAEASARADAVMAEQLARIAADDAEIAARQTAVASLQSYIDSEVLSRQGAIEQEAAARAAAVSAEQARASAAESLLGIGIQDERNDRIAAVSAEETARIAAVSAEAAAREAAVNAEALRALAAEAGLLNNYNDEVAARIAAVSAEETRATAAETAIAADLAAEVTARGVAVSAEEAARIAADDALDVRLDLLEADATVVNSIRYLIAQVDGGASTGLAAEQAARIAADESLASDIAAEEARAIAAETALQGAIDAEAARALAAEASLSSDIAAEASARVQADNQINASIASVTNGLNAEIFRAQSAETTLQSNIDTVASNLSTETAARIAGDAATLATAKSYADGLTTGLKFKDSVRYAMRTTAKIWTGSGFSNKTMPEQFNAFAQQVSGMFNITAGDRFLITGDANGSISADAGIYVVQTVVSGGGGGPVGGGPVGGGPVGGGPVGGGPVAGGGGGITYSLVRAADLAVGADASGAFVMVENGSFWSDETNYNFGSAAGALYNTTPGVGFVCSATKGSDTVGAASLQFVPFSRMEQLSFQNGISKSGVNVGLNLDSSGGLRLNPFTGQVQIKTSDAHLALDSNGLSLTGALVNGTSADSEHIHSVVSVLVDANTAPNKFVKLSGAPAGNSSTDVLGYAYGLTPDNMQLKVALSGVVDVSMSADAMVFNFQFADGDTIYLSPMGSFATFAMINSGEYAIPVGRRISSTKLLVQIGQAVLKA